MGPFGDERQAGLFIQILDWMLVPLAVLWPVAVVSTYLAASAIADTTYDGELREMVRAVGEEARSQPRDAREYAALPVVIALRSDPVERFYVRLSDERGEVLAGDFDLPAASRDDPAPSAEVRFRDAFLDGERLRVAYGSFPLADGSGTLLVQVGQPSKRRRSLVGDVTNIVMVVILLLVPATVGLAWLGLHRGLRPLVLLLNRIEKRDPDDLSPIAPEDVPAEIAPLVNTLNRQLDRVRRNLDAQRRFVADAAHQMRTPLAGLKTQAQAALRGETLEQARARLDQIEESADQLNRLVAQLLSLARADDALTREAARDPVELNALLREICAEWADRALVRRVALGFDPAPDTVTIPGSALLLRELFANLLDNAIRYSPEGSEVAVRVEPGAAPSVAVEDSGSGIPPEDRELVFERFYRVLGTGQSGSGLGLSIVKAIAELHGATVRAQAGAGGHGTRFVVSFPDPEKTSLTGASP